MTVTVAGQRFEVDSSAVEHAVSGALPEPIREHFVVVAERRWPPKQVLGLVTGVDRADFTTHQARRLLTRLGFVAARVRTHASGPTPSGATSRRADPAHLVEELRPFIGQWVAVRGEDVLVAAPSPRQVVAWLSRHGQRAESMFRVPDSEDPIAGSAPL